MDAGMASILVYSLLPSTITPSAQKKTEAQSQARCGLLTRVYMYVCMLSECDDNAAADAADDGVYIQDTQHNLDAQPNEPRIRPAIRECG